MLAVAFLWSVVQIKMVKTTLQELQEHLQIDVQLKFLQQKDVDRINYYIDTFFKEKEQRQIEDAVDETQNMLIVNDVIVGTLGEEGTLGQNYFKYKFLKEGEYSKSRRSV